MFAEKFKQYSDFAEDCLMKREAYSKKYEENRKQLQEIEKQKNQPDIPNDDLFNNIPLSNDDLKSLGDTAAEEYLVIKDTKRKHATSGMGIQSDLYSFNPWKYMYPPTEEKQKEKKIDYGFDKKTPELNYQKTYFLCVDKIISFNINIYEVKKIPTDYWNRGHSACMGGWDTFKFYCGKNNYRFVVIFTDDCDCDPGMLIVKEVTDIVNQIKIKSHCDLFCQNTKENALKNFLVLLESDNFDDFVAKRYGHFFELPKLLEASGLIVSYTGELSLNNNTKLNDYEYTFVVTVETNKGTLSISPATVWDEEDHKLVLHPTLDEINKERKDFQWERIDHHVISFSKKPSWNFNYKSDKDFPELLRCINKYQDYRNGNYGYFDETYLNEEFIKTYLADFKNASMTFSEYKYNTPEIDCNIQLNNTDVWQALYKDRIQSECFPHDLYWMNLKYNSETDSKCHLVIKGKVYDVIKLGNDYYKDKKVFDPKKYQLDIVDIFDDINFSGSLAECCQVIKEFLINVYKVKTQEHEPVEWGDYADNPAY